MKRRLKGFVLATVFLLLVIMVLLAAGLFRLVPVELNWALRQRIDTEAYYAATGGFKHSLSWLGAVQSRKIGAGYNPPYDPFGVTAGPDEAYQRVLIRDPSLPPYKLKPKTPPANPTSDDTYYPLDMPALQLRSERLQFANDWTAEVTIFPDRWTVPHPYLSTLGVASSRPPCYTIVSCAYQDSNHNGKCDTALGEHYALRVESSVVAGTFSRYAYFVDRWVDQGGNSIRISLPSKNSKPVFGGPVHTNGVPILQVSPVAGFWNEVSGSLAVPHFNSDISFAGAVGETYAVPGQNPKYDGIAWFLGNFVQNNMSRRPFDEVTPGNSVPIPGRYERIFSKGQEALRPRDRIDLPVDSDRVALAAWGHQPGDPLPDLAMAGKDELFIRTTAQHPKGGAIVSGNVTSCLLDILDTDGKSVCNTSYNSPVPNAGAGVARVSHDNTIIYIAGTNTLDITSPSTSLATGQYFVTQTFATDPGGGTPIPTNYVAGTTTREVVKVNYGPGSVTVFDAPGGGPVGGISIPSVPISTSTMMVPIPIYSQTTLYQLIDGPYTGTFTVTDLIKIGETEEVVYASYSPTDIIVEPKEADILFHSSYLVTPPTGTTAALTTVILPVNVGAPASNGYLAYPVTASQASVLRQSRTDPRVYYLQGLDAPLNGAMLVMGELRGIEGWNRGPKTIQAGTRKWNPDGTSTGKLFDIGITGPIRQFGVNPGDVATNAVNSMGLLGKQIYVRVPQANVDPGIPEKFYTDRPLYIYSALLALKGQFLTDFATIPSAVARLQVVGSVVQESIGSLYDLGNGDGWFSGYTYDPNLSVGPPPAFPLDGTFEIFFFRVDSL